ncbi:MAG: TonB-dependent receptor, partial [Tateyamaria sp.]
MFGDPELNINQLEAHLLRATVTHDFSQFLKGNFNVFYGDYDKLYQNFYASGYSQANSPDQVTLDAYLDTTQREHLILSADLIGEFFTGDIGHTIVSGVELIDTTSNQDRWNAYWDTTSDDNEIFNVARPLNLRGGVGVNAAGQTTTNRFDVDLNDDTRVGIDVFSFYLQDEIAFNEQWHAVIGGRFDSFDIEVFNVKANETRSRRDEEVSPRLGLIYKPQQNVSLYTSFSETFLPRSGEQFANINGSNNALDPNTYQNLEAGLKWDFSQGLSLTTSIFEIEQSSPQVADNDPSTLDVIDSQTTGFEVQLQGMVTDRWFVSAGYSYLDGEQVNRSGPTGLRPRELPEHMFSVWNNYQVNSRLGLGLGLV